MNRTGPTLVALLLFAAPAARAGVAVLANRTEAPIAVRLIASDAKTIDAVIPPGASRPFFSDKPLTAAYDSTRGERSLALAPDSAHHFIDRGEVGGVSLRRIGIGPIDRARQNAEQGWSQPATPAGQPGPVPVLLCVDEEEPMHEELWRARLTRRLAKASAIVALHSGVELRIAGFARWRSDDSVKDFSRTLAEFERSTDPPGGAIAIGFSSQYHVRRGRNRLGGTRGPLRRHILLREFSPNVSEPERVELLVHELGHYLGAAHSPEPQSVMRPILGDRRVRLKDHRIAFDPVNTLAIAMLGEEVRRRGVRHVGQLSVARQRRLKDVYRTLAESLPHDPAARVLLARADRLDAAAGAAGDGLAGSTARVVAAVTQAAGVSPDAGDRRADRLIRAAARAAEAEPAPLGPRAFLLGIGIALDDTSALRKHPRVSSVAAAADPQDRRGARLRVLGAPTARGRADTLKHFAVTAALVAAASPAEAQLWGEGKEALDAQRGTGYSFADLAANRAGGRMAERVLGGSLPLAAIAERFRVNDFVPPLDGLDEGLELDEVIERYGGKGDPRFESQLEAIDARIDRLPPYLKLDLGID